MTRPAPCGKRLGHVLPIMLTDLVEGCFNRLKHWRDIATRFAKRASTYRACLVLIATLLSLC